MFVPKPESGKANFLKASMLKEMKRSKRKVDVLLIFAAMMIAKNMDRLRR